jgi:hypothetical protein
MGHRFRQRRTGARLDRLPTARGKSVAPSGGFRNSKGQNPTSSRWWQPDCRPLSGAENHAPNPDGCFRAETAPHVRWPGKALPLAPNRGGSLLAIGVSRWIACRSSHLFCLQILSSKPLIRGDRFNPALLKSDAAAFSDRDELTAQSFLRREECRPLRGL